jgi:sulfonate transport system substrate-binding protein
MTIRIGVNGHDPMILFSAGLPYVERRLAEIGEKPEWVAYSPGPKAPELLGSELDFVGCGQSPMLKAHAAGLPVVYVASSPQRPRQGQLLVRADSPITSVRDLKGRRVAVGTAGWPLQLVAVALANAGLSFQDITQVSPDPVGLEGAAQLLSGDVEAAVLLGPRLIEAEETGRVRRLIATTSAVSNKHLFTAERRFVEERPEVVSAILTGMEQGNLWVAANLPEAARRRAEEQRYEAAAWGGDARSWELMLRRMPWTLVPIAADFIAEQQHAATVFTAAGLTDRAGDVRAAYVPELVPLVEEAVARAHEAAS